MESIIVNATPERMTDHTQASSIHMNLVTDMILNGDELLQLQRLAEVHVGFSLTEACPLQCAHCIVSAVSLHEREEHTLSDAQAQAYALDLGALAAMGVRRISLTGGEPLIAERPLEILSTAAAVAGIETTVVTACHWAKTPTDIEHTVRRFRHVRNWHLSTDRFHLEFIPLDQVLTAASVIRAMDRKVVIRLAVDNPPNGSDRDLYQALRTRLDPGTDIIVQKIANVGRAEGMCKAPSWDTSHWEPCVSAGLFVRVDGFASPCCSLLAHSAFDNPFRLPRASEAGLEATYRAWQQDPLLRLIRAVGFAPVIGWVMEALPNHPVLRHIPRHACDLCVALWQEPGTAGLVSQRLDAPAVRRKVDELYEAVFGLQRNEASAWMTLD